MLTQGNQGGRTDPKRKRDGVGFDVGKAIETLHQAALDAGVVPKDDVLAATPGSTALVHLHGVGVAVCDVTPCRKAGLCHALHELIQYLAEVQEFKPLLDAADRSEDARAWLGSEGFRYADALQALMRYGKEQHALERALGGRTKHNHDRICVRPARIYRAMKALLASVDGFDEDLRRLASSRELGQRLHAKPRAALLTTVWRHLYCGGFTHDETFELVPTFSTPTTRTKVKDVVRKRVHLADERSLLPREAHPAFAESTKVERRRRRRPST